MKLTDIVAISGLPGLYKYIAQSSNGIIVESLADGRRSNATGSAKVSSLAEISVYTDSGDKPLSEVFTTLFEHTGGKESISPKATPDQLKALLAEIVPDYDRDMVHVSDMKKLVAWFNALVAAGMTDFSIETEETPLEEEENQQKDTEKEA